MNKPDLSNIPILGKLLEPNEEMGKAAKYEKRRISVVTLYCLCMIIAIICIFMVILHFFGGGIGEWPQHLRNAMDNILATAIILIFLDTIMILNDESRKQRNERRAILRHNKIIQPTIDMYIVRKNMVVTPNEKTVRKFQINADFTIHDMKDMFGPSELISDVGKSKIEIFAYYQNKLMENLTHLVESVDFASYQDLCDAAMRYINATTYGTSAVDAVVGYQNAMAGTKSMRSIVVNLIKEEPPNGRFIDAHPAMKNVYLLHQTINDQERALVDYLRIIQRIIDEEPKTKSQDQTEYE